MSLDLHVLAVVDTLYEFLDRSPAAVVLLDEHRRIVYANQRAAVLHARGDGISLSGGGVALTHKHDDSRLQDLIARALNAKGAGSAMRVLRLAGKRPYGIVIARLSGQTASKLRPTVCLVITDPDTKRALPPDRLQEVFGLTEAEGRLASLLAAGDDLKSAAQTLGITYGTARARLAEIFQKTDTCRQGELINLLLTTLAIV
jgi:DNA-binding CsgD family transcriptional regulator